MSENILEVKDLVVHFETDDGCVKAVNGMNFTIGKKKTLAMLEENRNNYLQAHGATATVPIHTFVQSCIDDMMLGEARPVQLDIEDFAGLLQRFNAGGVHFR